MDYLICSKNTDKFFVEKENAYIREASDSIRRSDDICVVIDTRN